MLLIKFSKKFCRLLRRLRFIFCLLLLGIFCLYTLPAYAMCSGLGCSCSVGTTSVAFGNYNPTSATAVTTTGNVAVTCSALVLFSVAYVISMNAGNSGSFSTRFMNLTGQHLNYNLYQDVAHTLIWGDGTGGSNTVSDSYTAIGLSETNNYTVYGLLPTLQPIAAGTYTDTITVTVTY